MALSFPLSKDDFMNMLPAFFDIASWTVFKGFFNSIDKILTIEVKLVPMFRSGMSPRYLMLGLGREKYVGYA